MTPKEKLAKLLQKSLNTKSPAIARELVELEEKILNGVQGEKGEDGYTPIKGKDYFDGKDGEKGDKGDKGDTTIVEKVIVEKTEVIRETPIVTNEIKEVAIHETPEEIRFKLESLKDEDRLDASAIKNLPEFVESKANGGGWRNLWQLHDTTIDTPTDGQVLTYDNITQTWKNENPTGTLDGSGTANEIAYWVDSDTLGTLAVATYPSLTELSYVKGVTSAIQTQLNGKQATLSLTTTGSSGASTLVGATLNIPNYTLAGLGGANTALSNLASVAINTALLPGTSDSIALGSTTKQWSDLFLGSGGVLNWNAGDMLATHSSNALRISGGTLNVDSLGYNTLRSVFGERKAFINELTDALWKATKRFTVTQSGAGILANMFDGDYETNMTIPVSTTNVININVANQSGVPSAGITYTEGKVYVHFYYTNHNYSAISMRVKLNTVWTAVSAPTDISTDNVNKVLQFDIPNGNYLTDIELTVTTNGTDQVLITAMNYIMERWTDQTEVPYFDKYATYNRILSEVLFRTGSQTTSGYINPEGNWYMGVGGTGGKFGIGTDTPGTYHLNVAGNILGNDIVTNSGSVFASLGPAYLRAAGTNGIHIGDSGVQPIDLGVGGGAVGINTDGSNVASGEKLEIVANSATTSANLLRLSGGSVGFSGANDAGAYSLVFDGTAYQGSTGIIQVDGAKIQFAKENTWNYADTPTGTLGSLNFYTSAGTPASPSLTKQMTIGSSGLVTLTAGMYVGTTIQLGHASDTTLSRVSAGVVAIEGVNILTTATGQPLDTQLTSLAALTYAGNGGKYIRLNAGETDFEFVTLAGGGDALTTNPLSQFAATTSLQLKGVISDETGSGALVFADTPTLVTPILGTPTSVTLTNATGLPIAGLVASTSTAIGVGSVELGHASDTTIARVSAGVISVEGVTIPTISSTSTLTNKRITKRVVTTTDDATAVIDVDVTDVYELSAVANATTFSTTGTPTDGQTILIRFKDAGVAKGLTWDAVFVAIGVTLPTTTVVSKWHYVGVQYNSSATKWHAIAVSVEA